MKLQMNDHLQKFAEELVGGKGDGLNDSEVSQKQLDKGVKIEAEHTPKKSMRKEIAKDHLDEFPDYYDRLELMEALTSEQVQKLRKKYL